MDWPLYGNGQQIKQYGFTTLTAPGGANSKGAWTVITSRNTTPGQGVLVCLFPLTNTLRTFLVDIGVGASTEETVIIPNLFTTIASDGNAKYFYFPISIPQDARITARYQSNNATSVIQVALWVFSQGIIASSPYSRVEAIGADTSDSGGTQVIPADSNAKGNYAVLGTTTRDIYELTLSVGNSAGDYVVGSGQFSSLDIAIGPASSERVIVPDIMGFISGLTDVHGGRTWPTFPVHIPARTRISARAQSSATAGNVENLDVVIHGLAI